MFLKIKNMQLFNFVASQIESRIESVTEGNSSALSLYIEMKRISKLINKEIKKIQESYIQCLADETNMTAQQIKRYLKQKTNVYLTAEEAVELGLADEIF